MVYKSLEEKSFSHSPLAWGGWPRTSQRTGFLGCKCRGFWCWGALNSRLGRGTPWMKIFFRWWRPWTSGRASPAFRGNAGEGLCSEKLAGGGGVVGSHCQVTLKRGSCSCWPPRTRRSCRCRWGTSLSQSSISFLLPITFRQASPDELIPSSLEYVLYLQLFSQSSRLKKRIQRFLLEELANSKCNFFNVF